MNKIALRLFLLVVFLPLAFATNAQGLFPKWALGPFIRPENVNPIISPKTESLFFEPMSKQKIAWEAGDVFNPAAVEYKNKIYVLYRGEDRSGIGIGKRTSRIGIAESSDGIKMKRNPKPVLYPDEDNQKASEWPGGCEDPRIAVTAEGLYIMLYTQWNRNIFRLAVATSKDLKHWTKHGAAFSKAYNGKFKDLKCKSGSIVTRVENGKQVIAKINSKYMMYWGERFMNIATSADLINWEPALNAKGDLDLIVKPRKNYFDSDLTECGPPAIVTDKGILVLYNGKNRGDAERDTNYVANTYSAGQVLFDLKNPSKVIARLDQPFFVPTAPFEKAANTRQARFLLKGWFISKRNGFYTTAVPIAGWQ
ncbi:glycoside hydrolase family 130 protein [Pedobacter sp. P26]|uniref:glycoside hydrolase family 130 protein n=1 Tax=Pedobacter sp. P26 TaxID=3423956 RepID=UPI003D6700A9